MKSYKKIFTAIIVAITIIGLVAFYVPIRNIRPKVSSPMVSEDLSASLNNLGSSISTSTSATSSEPASLIPSFKEMSGFSGLNQESDLLEDLEASSSVEEIEKIFEELNQ
jgi:hypothetical protein